MRRKLLSITQFMRLPSICVLCHQFHRNPIALCSDCYSQLKPLGQACQSCAYPLSGSALLSCGQCIKNPPYFDKALIGYPFEEPLRSLLHQFKYQHALHLRSFLTKLMLSVLIEKPLEAECLIPVPMHPKRLKQRGFNQALVLAKALAAVLKRPYDAHSCQKIINTLPQANLNGEQRKKNLAKAFSIRPLPYQHVVLIDDLLTTGSTANELARALKKAGVKQVDIWCCARTVIHS